MSPHVSAPRRRLPTGMNSASGPAWRRWEMTAAATSCVSANRWRPACCFRSSRALRMSASFFSPIPLRPRSRPRTRCGLEFGERRDAERPIEQRDRLGSDSLQVHEVRAMWRGTRPAVSRWKAAWPVSASSRDPAGQIAGPMPGSSRSAAVSSDATGSAQALTVSAPFRYARILKGFSPLISSRSAISASTRATAMLSNPQALGLDVVVQQLRACPPPPRRERRRGVTAARRRRCTPRRRPRRTFAASAPARPALAIKLSMNGVVTPGARRFRFSHSAAICRPTSSQSSRASACRRGDRGVADPLEAVEDLAVAVDVPLGHLPVVRPRSCAGRRCRPGQSAARSPSD